MRARCQEFVAKIVQNLLRNSSRIHSRRCVVPHPWKGWVNNRVAGDFRLHRAHYDVTVMNHRVFAYVLSPNCSAICTMMADYKWYVFYVFFLSDLKVLNSFSPTRRHFPKCRARSREISSRFENSNLTHLWRVTHICFSKLTTIGSDRGLSSDWRQAFNWTKAEILLIGLLGTNFSEI